MNETYPIMDNAIKVEENPVFPKPKKPNSGLKIGSYKFRSKK